MLSSKALKSLDYLNMKEEPALGSNFPDKHLYVMYVVRANVDFLPPSFLTTILYVKLTVFTGSLKYWLAVHSPGGFPGWKPSLTIITSGLGWRTQVLAFLMISWFTSPTDATLPQSHLGLLCWMGSRYREGAIREAALVTRSSDHLLLCFCLIICQCGYRLLSNLKAACKRDL